MGQEISGLITLLGIEDVVVAWPVEQVQCWRLALREVVMGGRVPLSSVQVHNSHSNAGSSSQSLELLVRFDFSRRPVLTNDVDVVALLVHGLHLGAAEAGHGGATLHEGLVELALQL